MCKAFKSDAIVNYCEPLITQQINASGLHAVRKLMRENDFFPLYSICYFLLCGYICNHLNLGVI